MKKTMKKRTKDYIIAYFDILGYKNIINNNLLNENEFIKIISEAVKQVIALKSDGIWGNKHPQVYCFSDNFVICINYDKSKMVELIYNFAQLAVVMQIIQYNWFVSYNLLIRGSIVIGELYLKNSFIYGQGLIDAYMLENTIAIYPRIVVQEEIVSKIIRYCTEMNEDRINNEGLIVNETNILNTYFNFSMERLLNDGMIDESFYREWYDNYSLTKILKDFDGIYFIDFLQFAKRDYHETEEFSQEELWEIVKAINKNNMEFYLKRFSDNYHVLKKLLWLCDYINDFYIREDKDKIFKRNELIISTHVNLENISKFFLQTALKKDTTQNEKKHLLKLVDIIDNL